MPVCEADPWRLQYFEGVPCPADVRIPTEDADAWVWHPRHRWIYDKLKIAQSQGLDCGPHGVMPERFPVFSKPVLNLKGMGVGSRVLRSEADCDRYYAPGHFWMTLLEGEHVSTDCAVADGMARWWRHATGKPAGDGTFDYWTIHAELRPELEAYLGGWIEAHLGGYTGMINFETIGGRIIEAHLRFADQWPDLYGSGWVEALIGLYEHGAWMLDEAERRDGYSVPLFGRHGPRYRHPPAELVAEARAMPEVASVQITFHESKPAENHAMPPGGFRLAIVNARDLAAGLAARRRIAEAYPTEWIISQ